MSGLFNGISFSGRMGSGKNYCATRLLKNKDIPRFNPDGADWVELSFGQSVKKLGSAIVGAPCFSEDDKNAPIPEGAAFRVKEAIREMFFGDVDTSDGQWRFEALTVAGKEVCSFLELVVIIEEGLAEHAPRTRGRLLQVLGTEIVREKVSAEFWAELLRREIVALNARNARWVVTDARFPNEIKMIKSLGGLCVYVSTTVPYTGTRDPNHASERALDGMHLHTLINNRTPETDGRIEDLLSGPWDTVWTKLAALPMQEVAKHALGAAAPDIK